MLFAEILLAIMNATVSKIFTEIFSENASKQSKSFKVDSESSTKTKDDIRGVLEMAQKVIEGDIVTCL